MATRARPSLSGRARARAVRIAGIAIILLSVGAAFLPAGKSISSDMIGGLLIAAGLIETIAGSLRREARPFAMAAGIVTALAGLLFVTDHETHFFPRVVPIIGWLLARSLILVAAQSEVRWIGAHLDSAVRRHGFPAGVLLNSGALHLDPDHQSVRTDARAGCELRLGPGGELRGERTYASRSRKLRRGIRLATRPESHQVAARRC